MKIVGTKVRRGRGVLGGACLVPTCGAHGGERLQLGQRLLHALAVVALERGQDPHGDLQALQRPANISL